MATQENRYQFQSLFDTVLTHKGTADIASLADGVGASQTFTVPGAALGDFVLVAGSVSFAGITVTGYVSAANTVTVRVQNESGGVVDLASMTWYLLVMRPAPSAFV